MIWKILITVSVIVVAWTLLSRKTRGARPQRRLPNKADQALVRCKECGIYLPEGVPCSCKGPSRSGPGDDEKGA